MDDADRRRWSTHPVAALAALRVPCCGLFVRAKGHEKARRDLPEGVLIYCTQGRGFVRVGAKTKEMPMGPGGLVWLPSSSDHAYRADPADPWTIAWMHLDGPALPSYEAMLGLDTGAPRHIGIQEELIDLFHELAALHHPGYDDSRLLSLQGAACGILGCIGRLPAGRAALTSAAHGIRAAMDLMDAELHRPFELARYAKAAGLSEGYFTRIFRKACGKSPIDHFLEEKMHRASMLLSFSEAGVKDIAASLGYDDALYFSRVFKKRRGLSPAAYRARQAEIAR